MGCITENDLNDEAKGKSVQVTSRWQRAKNRRLMYSSLSTFRSSSCVEGWAVLLTKWALVRQEQKPAPQTSLQPVELQGGGDGQLHDWFFQSPRYNCRNTELEPPGLHGNTETALPWDAVGGVGAAFCSFLAREHLYSSSYHLLQNDNQHMTWVWNPCSWWKNN